MRLLFSVLAAVIATSYGYNLRSGTNRNYRERDLTVDDSGNPIVRDYSNSQFINDEDSTQDDPDFVVSSEELASQEAEDEQISSEEPESSDYGTMPPPEREPYLNSKFDQNAHWQNTDSDSWAPSGTDIDQLNRDQALSQQYDG